MTPEEKQQFVDQALAMHTKGFNCAQCVAVATCGQVGLDPDATFRIMEGFGAGMGGITQTCGALSGAVAVVSQASSNGMEACNSKKITYGWVGQLPWKFQQQFGSCICADIRPEEPELRMPVCNKYIAACVEMALDMIEEVKASK
ncbi:MAG: C-GCAxxG-C-C family protein [Coriobacteriia bacterium]|nr:C-GCAxxG-C-C family protein [Coriobacteriia bacterium]